MNLGGTQFTSDHGGRFVHSVTCCWAVDTSGCYSKVAVNICVQSLCGHAFSFLLGGYLHVEALGLVFHFLKHCQTILAVSVLHSHQQCMGILISPYLPHLLVLPEAPFYR